LAEAPNELLQAWMQNVQLQFDHVDESLKRNYAQGIKHDDRLKAIETRMAEMGIMQTERGKATDLRRVQQDKRTERQDRKIEKNTDYYIGLIKEWGPWIAIGIMFAKDLIK
jgi:hypothetical protein